MKALFPVIRLLLGAAPQTMWRGAALGVVVLVMGAALLGLSGWFITATGVAGLAGIGIAFDVFRPSAGVRFLALGRTAARYGERILTHDATLRALAALRVMLLRQQARLNGRALENLRSEATLTRIVSDVDALDGVALRFVLPLAAAILTHTLVFFTLGWLVGWPVAWVVLGGYIPCASLILWILSRQSVVPSDQVEVQDQKLRRGVIDMIRDRQSLILNARLHAREAELVQINTVTRQSARALDRIDRNAGAWLSALVAVATGAALVAGGWMVTAGIISPAVGAIGIFVALALSEAVLPLRRGFSDFGRMVGAAQRIGDLPKGGAGIIQDDGARTSTDTSLVIQTPTMTFDLHQGDAIALTGPSGSGKTSLLMQVAALAPSEGITVLGQAPEAWSDAALRRIVTMVPQRSALITGTIRENLTLAIDASDEDIWSALEAVVLVEVIKERGGLEARLGEAGIGLSGGQARRLTLARAILRSPRILLLDEPTEGLDAKTADRVLTGIRVALPEAIILAALHRGADHPIFKKQMSL